MSGIEVRPAQGEADIASARALFEDYERWTCVDLSFQNFAEELRTLPGNYAAPGGVLFLAFTETPGQPGGCIAVRRIDEADCEMKRLFVSDSFRGLGMGESLATAAIDWAREAGYARMLLDTLPSMGSAHRLYERLGFAETSAYRHNPVPGARFMALSLARLS